MSGDQIHGMEEDIPGSAGEKAVEAVEDKSRQIEGPNKGITQQKQMSRDEVDAMINAKARSITKPYNG